MSYNFEDLFGIYTEPQLVLESDNVVVQTIYGSSMWNRKKLSYSVDYVNRKINYSRIWVHPEKDVSQHVTQIIYNNRHKKGQVLRMLEKIKTELFQVHKIMIQAETQLKTLIKYRKFLKQEPKKNQPYIDELTEDLKFFKKHYQSLRDYYSKLPLYREKYELLLGAIVKKKTCFDCLKTKSGLVQFKTIRICRECQDKKSKARTSESCPVCLESFTLDKMVETQCRNGHFLCSDCYQTLRNYSAACPMCRGRL